MQETLITFETAKLAKEKGFNIVCGQESYFKNNATDGWDSERIEKPTQSLLQKWLREVYGLHIVIISISQESWDVSICKKGDIVRNRDVTFYCEDFYNYEEALEQGLYEALKLIKTS